MVPFASRTCYLCRAAANKNPEPSWQTWTTLVGHNDRSILLLGDGQLLLKELKLKVEGVVISIPMPCMVKEILGKDNLRDYMSNSKHPKK